MNIYSVSLKLENDLGKREKHIWRDTVLFIQVLSKYKIPVTFDDVTGDIDFHLEGELLQKSRAVYQVTVNGVQYRWVFSFRSHFHEHSNLCSEVANVVYHLANIIRIIFFVVLMFVSKLEIFTLNAIK